MNIARQRLVHQRLIDKPFASAADVVSWLGAVQAQDYPNAKWGVGLRMRAATNEALDAAFNAGEIVRTHVLRPTWHFVAARDLRWIIALTGPRVQAANARVYQQHELDDVVFRKTHPIFRKALAGKQSLTRAELAALLTSKRINASGQRSTFIAMQAELAGLICSGPIRGKQHTYMLIDERVPRGPMLQGDEALAELARRYFRSHGPATAQDFAWWSGQAVSGAKRALQMLGNELEEAITGAKTYFWADGVTAKVKSPVVHLLPNYDEHVVAYRDHAPSLDPRAPDALTGWGNGLTPHQVSLNGLVIGGWRRTIEKERVAIRLTVPVKLSASEQQALDRAARAYGAFIGLPVEVNA